MPIVNYTANIERARKRFINNSKISQANKDCFLKYLQSRDISIARVGIYLNHIPQLLERTTDITQDMHNRDKINAIFEDMRHKLGIANYSIVVDISQAFVRWLNNGDKPAGFRDIRIKGSKLRDLVPEDMLTWDDAEKMMGATTSLQFKAIIATQLDAGFRPSEFVDLNYGDVRFERYVAIIHIKGGKTGTRDVICKRCVQILQRWCREHPSKKRTDPLWVMENFSKSNRENIKMFQDSVIRYSYAALQKRLRETGRKMGIKKPLDFYNFRHSSCVLDKKDNLPNDLGARRHGHSLKYYDAVYGRLSTDDLVERTEKHYGLSSHHPKQQEKGNICDACKFVNKPKAEICEYCGQPLTVKMALDMRSDIEKELATQLAAYKHTLGIMQEQLNKFKVSEIRKRIREVKRLEGKKSEKDLKRTPDEIKQQIAKVVTKR